VNEDKAAGFPVLFFPILTILCAFFSPFPRDGLGERWYNSTFPPAGYSAIEAGGPFVSELWEKFPSLFSPFGAWKKRLSATAQPALFLLAKGSLGT